MHTCSYACVCVCVCVCVCLCGYVCIYVSMCVMCAMRVESKYLCFKAIQPHGLPTHLHAYLAGNNKERKKI